VIDYADTGDDDAKYYKRLQFPVDLAAEGSNEYNQSQSLKVYSPWLGQFGDDITAFTVANRMLNRYRDTPDQITFTADIKDKDDLEPAALIELTTRVKQSVTGANEPAELQVTSVNEVSPGNRIQVVAETYQFTGRYGFITENARGTYAAATDFEKSVGTYIVDESTLLFPDGTGPYVIF